MHTHTRSHALTHIYIQPVESIYLTEKNLARIFILRYIGYILRRLSINKVNECFSRYKKFMLSGNAACEEIKRATESV